MSWKRRKDTKKEESLKTLRGSGRKEPVKGA